MTPLQIFAAVMCLFAVVILVGVVRMARDLLSSEEEVPE